MESNPDDPWMNEEPVKERLGGNPSKPLPFCSIDEPDVT
jgi:hypothetical protein